MWIHCSNRDFPKDIPGLPWLGSCSPVVATGDKKTLACFACSLCSAKCLLNECQKSASDCGRKSTTLQDLIGVSSSPENTKEANNSPMAACVSLVTCQDEARRWRSKQAIQRAPSHFTSATHANLSRSLPPMSPLPQPSYAASLPPSQAPPISLPSNPFSLPK